MAFEERDPGDLKLRIVDLLLGHPQGVNFGDFSGAFYQLHGFHPHIYLYGYSSLRQLIADMKDLVVVECGSQTPVMKLVNGLNLDRWLEGEENGLQNPQEESQCLINGEQAEQLSVGLADVLAALSNLLTNYTSGLRITKLQEFLLASDGVDLEKVSIGQGYKDALEFLETQMPELNIHYREDRSNSVVKLPAGTSIPAPGPGFSECNRDVVTQKPIAKSPGLADVLVALHNLLTDYKSGLMITKLQEFLLASDGVDLEKFSIGQGYMDTLMFLETQMPELNIHYQKDRLKCVVQLSADASTSSASSDIQNSVEEPPSRAPVLSDIVAKVTNLLIKYKLGLKINKLQDFLLSRDGIDLEKFSISQGFKGTLEFLKSQRQQLNIQYQENRINCVVKLCIDTDRLSNILKAVTNLLAKYKFGLKIKKVQELLLAGDGIDLEKFSISQGYTDTLEFLESQMQELIIQYQEDRLSCVVKLPADIVAAVTNLLGKYEFGLKIKKVEKLMRTGEGIDLEKISISQGYTDTLEFLEAKMPELNIQYQEDRLNCVVKLPADPVDPVDPVDLSNIVTAVTNLLVKYKSGLKIKNVQEFLLARDGIDLEKISINHGYKNMLKFLKAQMPKLIIQRHWILHKCVVQLPADSSVTSAASSIQNCVEGPTGQPPDSSVSSAASSIQNCVEGPTAQPPELSVAFFLIREVLKGQPHGLKLKKLKKALNENCRFNLETFCSNLGYKDVMSCLQDMPGLLLRNITKPRNYVVQLESRACSPAPSLDSDFSACNSDTTPSGLKREEFGTTNLTPRPDFCACSADAVPQPPVATSPGACSPTPCHVPGFSACNTDTVPQKPVAKCSVGLADLLVTLHNLLTNYKSGLRITKLQEFLLARDGVDLEKFSIGQGYKDTLEFLETQMPELNIHYQEDRLKCVVQLSADASTSSASSDIPNSVEEPPSRTPDGLSNILTAVTNLLAKYKSGLKIKKVQEFLLAGDGIDLEKFSISQGYTDTLELLESQMQELIIQYQEDRLSCVVQLPAALLDMMAAVTNLLVKYKSGLKIKKVEKLLRTGDGIDLQKISISQGYTDTLEFLEAKMPELNIHYQENRLNCVVKLPADASPSSTSSDTQNSVEETASRAPVDPVDLSDIVTAVTNLLVKYKLGLKIKKVQEFLLAEDGIDLEKISISHGYKTMLQFLEAQMPELIVQRQDSLLKCVVQLPAAPPPSCSSPSSPLSVPLSFDLKQPTNRSKPLPLPQNVEEKKKVALAEGVTLVNNLLAMYRSGLTVKEMQEFLLAVEGFDLEKFSIAQGYKDSLQFLVCQVPKLAFINQADRLSCVIKRISGPGVDSAPPLLQPAQVTGPINSVLGFGDNGKPLCTACDASASKSQDQSLPVPAASVSPAVENGCHTSKPVPSPPIFASSGKPCSTLHSEIGSSPHLLCPNLAQPPRPCQLTEPSSSNKVSCQLDAKQLRKSILVKDQPSKDLEEVKRRVAHILATHPEGLSLFQFRVAYSAMYQQHLPLGNASSAKQCLLEMPDVVRLKGCGVQTLLLPVSSPAFPAAPGQPVSSTVEETSTVPGHVLPPTRTGAEPGGPRKPVPLSKVPEVPQQCPISFLAPDHYREPGGKESSLLPGVQPLTAPKTTNPWDERQRARVNAEDTSGQPDLSRKEKATVDPAIALPKASIVGPPKSCLKPPAQHPAAMPKPQPRLSLLQSSERRVLNNNKECSLYSQSLLQKAPIPNLKPACAPFPPQPPVVFPTVPQATRWDKNFRPSGLVPKPTHFTNPWGLGHGAPVAFVPQPVSDRFQAWAQPIVCPPVTFLSEIPDLTRSPASFFSTPVNPSQISKSALQSHLQAQMVTPKKPAQVPFPIHSAEQWTYTQGVPQSTTISQVQKPAGTLPPIADVSPAGWPPLPSSRKAASSISPKSQAVHQPPCSNHSLQDDLQGLSLTGAEEKLPDTTLEGTTSKPSPSMYPGQYSDADSLLTPSSTLSFSSPSPSLINASQQPSYASSSIKKNTNSPSEAPAFTNQQQSSSRSSALATSDTGLASSPSSLSDPITSPCNHLLHPSSSIASNSDVLFSDRQSFIHCQPHTSVNVAVTMSSTHPRTSPPYSVESTTSSCHKASGTFWMGGIDDDASDQRNAMPTVVKQTGSPSVSLPRKQTPHNSSPPPKHSDRCVIL